MTKLEQGATLAAEVSTLAKLVFLNNEIALQCGNFLAACPNGFFKRILQLYVPTLQLLFKS